MPDGYRLRDVVDAYVYLGVARALEPATCRAVWDLHAWGAACSEVTGMKARPPGSRALLTLRSHAREFVPRARERDDAAPARGLRWLAAGLFSLAVGVGAAATLSTAARTVQLHGTIPPGWPGSRRIRLAPLGAAAGPLALAGLGVVGLLLRSAAQREATARRALEPRAGLLERLVPRPRARVDRIVIHA